MHDESGSDVCGCDLFQYGADGDEQNGSKSKMILLMTRFAGESMGEHAKSME